MMVVAKVGRPADLCHDQFQPRRLLAGASAEYQVPDRVFEDPEYPDVLLFEVDLPLL